MTENIIYLKLITGEDLIALVDSINDDFICIYNIIQLVSQDTNDGAYLKAKKWIPYIDKDVFELNCSHVVFKDKPSDIIIEYYYDIVEKIYIENEHANTESLKKSILH